MPTMADVRQKYPQYNDMSDADLASALHKKFYADMPEAEFNAKIGLAPTPAAQTAPQEAPSLLSAAGQAVVNSPGSVLNAIGDMYQGAKQMVTHPLDTYGKYGELVTGMADKAGLPTVADVGAQGRPVADAFIQNQKDAYGSWDKFKNTLAKDPARVFLDAATIGTGGGAMLAKAPGMVGRMGVAMRDASIVPGGNEVVRAAARTTGSGLANGLGMLTRTGGESIKTAARAGFNGGDAATIFADNLRGNVGLDTVVADSKRALANMRMKRGAAYRGDMAGINQDRTILDFKPILSEMDNVTKSTTYKGKSIAKSTDTVVDNMKSIIDDWANSDPAEFHTVEGMDALKRALGDVRDSAPYGTPARNAADKVYTVVRQQIIDQAPDYARVMKDYEQASSHTKEIEKALSLGRNTATDTALRKLQSVTRNNANTNYGNRVTLAKELEANGAPNLTDALSGQALNSVQPRGWGGAGQAGLLSGMALYTHNPAFLVPLAMSSPRVAGEAAFLAGKTARGATKVAKVADRLTGSGLSPAGRKAAALALWQMGQER